MNTFGDMIIQSKIIGQQNFVCDQTLPIDMGEGRNILEKWGFVFGSKKDDLFIYCKFPSGWKKVPTEHQMWSDLLDDKGMVRAQIFYKAAFYDQRAFLGLRCRFEIQAIHNKNYDVIGYKAIDNASSKELAKTRELSYEEVHGAFYKNLKDLLSAEIKQTMNLNYPGWNDHIKSWEYPV